MRLICNTASAYHLNNMFILCKCYSSQTHSKNIHNLHNVRRNQYASHVLIYVYTKSKTARYPAVYFTYQRMTNMQDSLIKFNARNIN